MQYKILGKTGLDVSRICLGMMSFGNSKDWMLETDDARPIVEKALDLGVNFFDTANVYSSGRSEEITGELLQDYRDDVVIATKVFFPLEGFITEEKDVKPNKRGLSRYHIIRAINDSLERLQTEYVDLYQIHRLDPKTHLEEIMRSLNHLIEDGTVLHIGASSMFAWQFAKSFWVADRLGLEPFRTMQNHYNLVYREEEREMLPLCLDQQVAVIPWSPLARGFLSGKYKRDQKPDSPRTKSDGYLLKRYFRDEDFDVVERLVEVASEKDVTAAQIALAWLFSKDVVTAPIIGSTKVEHVEQAVGALEIKLTTDDIKHLEESYTPHKIIGHS
ncbi:MAG: aldo/keto reductase [Candidatus Hodarchaeales archaeon]|jgi:aryl-alcohol dehydrogenase (NADP+)